MLKPQFVTSTARVFTRKDAYGRVVETVTMPAGTKVIQVGASVHGTVPVRIPGTYLASQIGRAMLAPCEPLLLPAL